VDHCGQLAKGQKKELSVRFLRGFEKLERYFRDQAKQKKLKEVLGFDWLIP
jgi:hypothetical protein